MTPMQSTWFQETKARSTLQPLPPCRFCGKAIDEESTGRRGPATSDVTGAVYHAECLDLIYGLEENRVLDQALQNGAFYHERTDETVP
jgi:hypothetical protein